MKWNWYESDFEEPNFQSYGSSPTAGIPKTKPPESGGGGGWWDWATTSFLPEYDKDAWYNKSLLEQFPGRLGEMGRYATESAKWTQPWIEQGYEKLVRPIASPLGIGLTGATLATGGIGALGAAAPEVLAASRFAPLLEAAAPAARAAVAASNTVPGLAVGNLAKGGLALGGLGMAGQGLYGAIEEGKEFYKDPSNVGAAKIGGDLAEAYMGYLGMKHGVSSMKGRGIEVPPQEPAIQLGPDSTSSRIKAIQATAAEKIDILNKSRARTPLTQREAEILAEILPNRPGDPFKPPTVPTDEEALASLGPRLAEPYKPPTYAPISDTAVTPEEIAAKTGSLFSQKAPRTPKAPAPGVQVPAPAVSRFPYGPEPPPPPPPEIPLARAQQLLTDAAQLQREGNIEGARILRQQIADSVRAAGYSEWAATIEKMSARGPSFRSPVPGEAPPGEPGIRIAGINAPPENAPPTPNVVGNVPLETPPTQPPARTPAKTLSEEWAEKAAAEAAAKKAAAQAAAEKVAAEELAAADKAAAARTAPTEKTPIEPAGGYTNTRAQKFANRVAELDAANAPDEAYRGIVFSERTTLKPGETWRDRTLRRISGLEAASPGKPSAFQGTRPETTPEPPPFTPPPVTPPPAKEMPVAEPVKVPEPVKAPEKVVKAPEGESFWEAKAKLDDRAASGEDMKYEEELAALKAKFGQVETPRTPKPKPVVEKPVVEEKPVEVAPTSKFKGTRAETSKPVDLAKVEKQKARAIEEGYEIAEPGKDIGKQPVVRTLADGSRIMDPRSKFAPEKPVEEPAPAGAPEPSKFKGTRPETEKIPKPVEEAPPSEGAPRKKAGEFQSDRAQELAAKVAELDAANAPDADYRNALSLAARRDKLLPGETWKGRVQKAISFFEEQAAKESGSPFSPRKFLGKEGEKGSVFFGRGKRTAAKQRAAEVASMEVEPVPESTTGLSPAEMAARQKHGVPELAEGAGGPTQKVTKDWMPKAEKPKKTVKEIIQTAYGKRTAAPIEGLYESKEVAAFDKERDALTRAYNNDPAMAKLRNYFTRTRRLAKEQGLSYEGIMQKMWSDETDPKDFEAVFGQRDAKTGKFEHGSKQADFSFKQIYEDLEKGKQAGLTPKFEKPSELVSFLENEIRNKIGKNEAFNDLMAAGHIKAGSRKDMPKGWKQLDPNIVPGQIKYRTVKNAETGKDELVPVEYWAEASTWKDLRSKTWDKLEAFYKGPNKTWKTVADFFAFPKNIFLSGGVPWTSANKHAWNLANRAYKKGGPEEVMRFLKANEGNQDLKALIRYAKAGMQSSAEDTSITHTSGQAVKEQIEKIPFGVGKFANRRIENLQNVYEAPLFKKKLPSFKTASMKAEVERGMKAGLTREQAERRAADITNVFYGGISETPQAWLANHPTIQQGVRILSLAPDWLQTKVRLGSRELQALVGKQDPVYLESFKRGMGTTLGRKVVALALGKAAYEAYSPGTFPTGTSVQAPEGPKRSRNVDLLGTSDELQRIPEMFYKGYKEGDLRNVTRSFGVNQLNLPWRTAYNLSEGESATNEPLWTTKGKFGKPITATAATVAVIGEASAIFTPPVVNALIKYSQGKITKEEAFFEAGELPLVYRYLDKLDKGRPGPRLGR